MYLLFAQLISSCLAVPDQNVSIDRESCKAGGSSFVPAAVGASYGDVETRITHHQCKSIKDILIPISFFIHSSGQTKTGRSSTSAASRPLRVLMSWSLVSMTSTPIAFSTC